MIQKPLGKILVEEGYINNYQLSEALIKQRTTPGSKLGDILIQLGHLSTESLNDVLKKQAEIAKRLALQKDPLYKPEEQEKAMNIQNKELSALLRLLIKKRLIDVQEYFKELKEE